MARRLRKAAAPRKQAAKRLQPGDDQLVPVELLRKWLDRGTITRPLFDAGNRFHNQVISMHEPCLQAMPLVKVRVDVSHSRSYLPRGGASGGSLAAVEEALEAVGGAHSGTASVLYHVIGLEWPIRRWCQAVGIDANPTFASGMLVSGLEVLAGRPGKLWRQKNLLTRR